MKLIEKLFFVSWKMILNFFENYRKRVKKVSFKDQR